MDEGVDVTVITHGEKTEEKSIKRLNTPDIRYWRRPFFTHYVGKYITKAFKKGRFDVIHYNEPHILVSKPDAPIVSTFHSTQINELFVKSGLSRLISIDAVIETIVKTPIGSIGDIISSQRSDLIICPNKHLKHMIKKYCLYPEDKIIVINNGIETGKNIVNISDLININGYELEKDGYLLFVGRLDPIKGIEYLIEAFRKIKTRYRLKLVIAGTGFHETYLKKISVDEDILFIGYVADKNDLAALYENSLMLILPSLYEAIPMVLLEAMAYGKPIVASRVGGIPEFVLDGKNGYLVDPRNSDELAEKISRLVEDSELRTRIGSYNTRYVEKKYSLKMMVNKTLEAYERLLS